MDECAVSLLPIILIAGVHHAITEHVFEPLKFHHRAVIKLELLFAHQRLRIPLDCQFSRLKLLDDLFPGGKI